ncbi:unnamed protein product [Effrenium voratum]|uniref:Uncharacterized protein n=1 Tax=Effrenium voratum TaxID=2562239 RepID=A0AA36J860_9DINO|nr:unnamed protein product [Effrenium voratum]
MGLSEHAAIHHQHAIEYANRMGSKDAQCFTVGNLGIASAAQGDLQTSRICLQYHLSSAQRQKSAVADNKFAQHSLKEVSKSAYHRLGQVNATDGRFDEAADHFAKAMEAKIIRRVTAPAAIPEEVTPKPCKVGHVISLPDQGTQYKNCIHVKEEDLRRFGHDIRKLKEHQVLPWSERERLERQLRFGEAFEEECRRPVEPLDPWRNIPEPERLRPPNEGDLFLNQIVPQSPQKLEREPEEVVEEEPEDLKKRSKLYRRMSSNISAGSASTAATSRTSSKESTSKPGLQRQSSLTLPLRSRSLVMAGATLAERLEAVKKAIDGVLVRRGGILEAAGAMFFEARGMLNFDEHCAATSLDWSERQIVRRDAIVLTSTGLLADEQMKDTVLLRIEAELPAECPTAAELLNWGAVQRSPQEHAQYSALAVMCQERLLCAGRGARVSLGASGARVELADGACCEVPPAATAEGAVAVLKLPPGGEVLEIRYRTDESVEVRRASSKTVRRPDTSDWLHESGGWHINAKSKGHSCADRGG